MPYQAYIIFFFFFFGMSKVNVNYFLDTKKIKDKNLFSGFFLFYFSFTQVQ